MPYDVTFEVEDLIDLSHSTRVIMVNSTYTISGGGIFICDASSGAFTITLPTSKQLADLVGEDLSRIITIKKKDSSANAVTVSRSGSDTIDGSTTYSLSAQYDSVTLCDDQDGDTWNVIAQV